MCPKNSLFSETKAGLIGTLQSRIHEAGYCISILKKVEIGGTYLITNNSGKRLIMKVERFGSEPSLVGSILAREKADPFKGDTVWTKFLDEVQPFKPEDSALCINWEYISEDFKNTYFKGE